MGRKTNSSLIILGFLFLMILQFFPRCLAARKLEDSPQPTSWIGGVENDHQSKSDVNGSKPRTAGSANGDYSPAGGVVNMPPTSFSRSVSSRQSNGSRTVTQNNNGVTTGNTTKWSDKQKVTNWNGHKSETESHEVNVTNNGNGGGQVYGPPNAPSYEAPNGPENPLFYFPPIPPPFASP
ncbi:hypothetical protein ACOSQ3_017975 [Xanthoceras sorbifolium]